MMSKGFITEAQFYLTVETDPEPVELHITDDEIDQTDAESEELIVVTVKVKDSELCFKKRELGAFIEALMEIQGRYE